jgi:LacI family transcriptional regulator
MGLIATNALLRLIHGEPAEAKIPPLELVVRETTRRYA